MGNKIVYDITSRELALQTLQKLTNFSGQYWDYEIYKYQKLYQYAIYTDTEELLNDIMERHNLTIDKLDLDNLDVCFFHVTTSNNECDDYYKYGVLDLQSVYRNSDTELRKFLDEREIYIDLDGKTICVEGKIYSISTDNGRTDYYDRQADKGYYVGNKFYNDFSICGFFCLKPNEPYGGGVDKRPEILNDICRFTRYNICKEWEQSHKTYIIKIKVCFNSIAPFFCSKDDEYSIKKELLKMAFDRYYYMEDEEKICILRKNVTIDRNGILYAFRHDFDRMCDMSENIVNFKGKQYGVSYTEKDGEFIAAILLDNMKHIVGKANTKEMAKLLLDAKLFELEQKVEVRKNVD